MTRFLPKLYLDISSFWAGVFIVLLLVVLIIVFRSRVKSFFYRIGQKLKIFRESLSVTSESDYNKVIYRYTQGLHLCAEQFPLDSILVPPLCIAPPPSIQPGIEGVDSSLIQQSFGYDPSLPEITSEFFGPTFSLFEALSSNTNICLVGYPGTGKTTAIADCISTLAKGKNSESDFQLKIPFYVKAHHILAEFPNSDLLGILLSALQANKVFLSIPNFSRFLTTTINSGNAVLFIDDLDLLTFSDTNRIANFITTLCRSMPKLQVVITASPSCLGNLVESPVNLISIAPWGISEKYKFLQKFDSLWTTIQPEGNRPLSPQASVRNSMLVVSDPFLTPFEFTLKSLSAYAGDITGPGAIQSLDSYLARVLSSFSKEAIRTLEVISLHTLEQQKSSFSKRNINLWLSELAGNLESDITDEKIAPINSIIQTSLDLNILQRATTDEFYFTYPTLSGYLAARCLSRSSSKRKKRLLELPECSLVHETMRFFSAFNDIQPHLQQVYTDKTYLKTLILRASLWLVNTDINSKAELDLLKIITREINTNSLYLIKLRLVCSLVKSRNPNIKNIFQHLLSSQDVNTRRAAAIGCGLIEDLSVVPLLINQLNDQFPSSTTACYVLGKIASPRSLEAIADCLLHGNELLRRAAAESLAQNRSEGHPALREGISMDDLLVRYAVVHGLGLIKETWAIEILDKMRIDEDEWVVRDLAQQIFEIHETGSPYLPQHQPPAHVTPWLDKYASEHGLAKPTAENALDLLLKALETGTPDQKQSVLSYLEKANNPELIPALAHQLESDNPDIMQQASLCIWYNAPPGYQFPY